MAQVNCPVFGSIKDTLATGGRSDTTTLSQSNQFLFALPLVEPTIILNIFKLALDTGVI